MENRKRVEELLANLKKTQAEVVTIPVAPVKDALGHDKAEAMAYGMHAESQSRAPGKSLREMLTTAKNFKAVEVMATFVLVDVVDELEQALGAVTKEPSPQGKRAWSGSTGPDKE